MIDSYLHCEADLSSIVDKSQFNEIHDALAPLEEWGLVDELTDEQRSIATQWNATSPRAFYGQPCLFPGADVAPPHSINFS